MDEPYLAAVRSRVRDFKWLIKRVSVLSSRAKQGSGEIHLEIREDKIEAFEIRSSSEQSYCTFTKSYFNGISLGGDKKVTAYVTSLDVLNTLDKFDGGDFVEFRFLDDVNANEGTTRPARASILQVRNVLTHRILCLTGTENKEPIQLRQRFSEDDRLLTEGDSIPATVHISIPADQMERFTSIIDGDEDSIVYPLVVRDEKIEFTFFPEGEPDTENWVHGELSTHSADGPDIKHHYPKYVGPIFEMLNGDVDLYTDPEEGMLAVVNKAKMGSTLRYVIPSVNIDIDDSPLKWV